MAELQTSHVTEDPNKPLLRRGEELLDATQDFDFDSFQVVRREFFSHQREPSITFNNYNLSNKSSKAA